MPESVVAPYSNNVVSGFDLHRPEFMKELVKRYGDQGKSFFQTIMAMGFEDTVSQWEYYWFEDDWITDLIAVKNPTVAGAPGADVTFEIASQSLDAANRFYLRLNDRVYFPNRVVARVKSIDTTTPTIPVVTLTPSDATDAIPAMTANQVLAIGANVFSDGSGGAQPAFRGATRMRNQTGIMKEALRAYGSEMTNQIWVEVVDGKGVKAWFDVGRQFDIDFRMQKQLSSNFLISKFTTNPNEIDPDTGEPYRTTEGLFPYAQKYANPFLHTPGMESVYDYDEFDSLLQANYAAGNISCWYGENIGRAYENKLSDFFKHTDIEMVTRQVNDELFGGDVALAATVKFKLLTKSDRTFMFKRWNELSDPKGFGATGYPFKNFGLLMPMDPNRKDAKTQKKMSNIGWRWKALGSYSRRMETFELGSANVPVATNDFDRKDMHQRCEGGACFMAGNQLIFVTPGS